MDVGVWCEDLGALAAMRRAVDEAPGIPGVRTLLPRTPPPSHSFSLAPLTLPADNLV